MKSYNYKLVASSVWLHLPLSDVACPQAIVLTGLVVFYYVLGSAVHLVHVYQSHHVQ